jgi:NHL repeat
MSYAARCGMVFVTGIFLVASLATPARAQSSQYPKPTQLPNPYRLVEGWPTLPESMNGGHWGEVIRVHVHSDGNIWVFHRCFNSVPPGIATCVGRGDANPPILQFDPSGKLLRSLGGGMFANPHGFTVDKEGNLWVSDVNDRQTVLGLSARNAAGVVLGQEVLKLDQNGKVLMMLGKMGVGGSGTDTFDRPTGVATAANGDIFVSDGHGGNSSNNARVLKFSKDGRFIKTGVTKDRRPAISTTHDISVGGSLGRVYVADRLNSRIQVFDQDGNLQHFPPNLNRWE